MCDDPTFALDKKATDFIVNRREDLIEQRRGAQFAAQFEHGGEP
jgi:hypothetical protein